MSGGENLKKSELCMKHICFVHLRVTNLYDDLNDMTMT